MWTKNEKVRRVWWETGVLVVQRYKHWVLYVARNSSLNWHKLQDSWRQHMDQRRQFDHTSPYFQRPEFHYYTRFNLGGQVISGFHPLCRSKHYSETWVASLPVLLVIESVPFDSAPWNRLYHSANASPPYPKCLYQGSDILKSREQIFKPDFYFLDRGFTKHFRTYVLVKVSLILFETS